VLQCAAVCCSVLQCAAVCCSVLQRVAVCCSVLQCIAACCSVQQCVAVCYSVLQCAAVCCLVLRCVAVGKPSYCAHEGASDHTAPAFTGMSKETYMCQKRPTCVKRDLSQETLMSRILKSAPLPPVYMTAGDDILAVCSIVLQCVVVCCSVLQCVAVYCLSVSSRLHACRYGTWRK